MVKDPICELECDKDTAFKSKFRGKTYYFCASKCKDVFDLAPDEYAGEYEVEE